MEIKYWGLLIFALVGLSCGNQGTPQPITDWERLNMKGRVKSCRLTHYLNEGEFGEFRHSKEEAPGNIWRVMEFNEEGYLTKDTNGELAEEFIFIYENDTKIIKKQKWNMDSNVLTHEFNYEYNDKGQLIKETKVSKAGGSKKVKTFEYDEKGNRIKDYSPLFNKILKLEYNDKRQAVKWYSYRNNREYQKNLVHAEGIREYDEAGNLILETSDSSEKRFKYDEHGNITERTSKSRGNAPRIRLYKYQYDEQNNWTKRQKKNHRYVVTQEIEYY